MGSALYCIILPQRGEEILSCYNVCRNEYLLYLVVCGIVTFPGCVHSRGYFTTQQHVYVHPPQAELHGTSITCMTVLVYYHATVRIRASIDY